VPITGKLVLIFDLSKEIINEKQYLDFSNVFIAYRKQIEIVRLKHVVH